MRSARQSCALAAVVVAMIAVAAAIRVRVLMAAFPSQDQVFDACENAPFALNSL
jgi:hypothetical protein